MQRGNGQGRTNEGCHYLFGVPCDRTPERGRQGLLTTNGIPSRRSARHWKILLLYNGFFEKASETWQSTVTKCVLCCTMVQILVVLGRSLTQPHQAVRTRTTRSKGRVSPHVPHEDGGNELIVPIRSFMFFFFLSLAPRRSRAEHPAADRAAPVVGAVRSAHTRRRKLSVPCIERSTIRFPFIPSSTAQGYLRLD